MGSFQKQSNSANWLIFFTEGKCFIGESTKDGLVAAFELFSARQITPDGVNTTVMCAPILGFCGEVVLHMPFDAPFVRFSELQPYDQEYLLELVLQCNSSCERIRSHRTGIQVPVPDIQIVKG